MIRKVSFFSFFSELILIFLILFVPLFEGSVQPLPHKILQLSILLLVSIFILRTAIISEPTITYPSSIFFMFAFFMVVMFQLIPLSQDTIKVLSPKTLQLYKQYLPFIGESSRHTLSIYPFATKKELIELFAFFALFFVVVNIMNSKNKFERLLAIITIWAAGLSLYGVMKKFFISGGWYPGGWAHDVSFSTFSHRNVYAGYMAMIAPLSIGYALSCQDKYKKLFFVFLGTLISVSIFVSASRGGTASLIFALLLLAFLSFRGVSLKNNLWIIVAVIIFLTVLLFLGNIETLKDRIPASFGPYGLQGRLEIAKSGLTMIKDFPLFGIGLGNGHYIINIYTLGEEKWLHNEYLELILEAGYIAAFFAFLFFAIVFKDILIQLQKQQDPFVRNVVAGGISGLFAVIIHSFFDVNFHIPATLFMFWLILGLVYKCVHTKFYEEGDNA
ncbi:MAG: O-antigen ligase family protein [Candidatus Omnitrophota bacterium]|nr:MAG: O-antigen ligase family protein [Candidatus Omnitrophota bacterium]